MPRNPSVHVDGPDGHRSRVRPRWELEKAAGRLELARKEAQMGVVGAAERVLLLEDEYQRLQRELYG
jgi:hypothetical protein